MKNKKLKDRLFQQQLRIRLKKWVHLSYFNLLNAFPKYFRFLLKHPVYVNALFLENLQPKTEIPTKMVCKCRLVLRNLKKIYSMQVVFLSVVKLEFESFNISGVFQLK